MENPNAVYNYNLFKIFFTEIEDRPAMVVRSPKLKASYVIPLDSAHKYADDDYLWQASKNICEMFRLGMHKNTIFKVGDLVLNHLQELIHMPPTIKKDPTMEDQGVVLRAR